ncbi:replication protein A 14 kDa subunit-like [Ananas comosus]|uniref:Replication protein A 14 kDa subunit-like n=1 Tax=Ananas comosus TaxID=4615 RepID=A0A6P5EMH1_ANACO|nr:replication protein A 14 kDa subunit-like [Ananas comosus]
MDTSTPAVFVNADVLKMYLGRRVRSVVQVMGSEGGTITGQSTDGHQLTIKGAQSFPLSHFIEVIGIADGNQSIRAEICTDFGENFDTQAYNGLCQLANGKYKNLFL